MTSLILRNIIFTILQPGVVAGLVPWLLVPNLLQSARHPSLAGIVGLCLFIVGLIILLVCIAQFARDGKGTLSPLDPTKNLVATGLYKYSRNPMYVGVTSMLAGECIMTGSETLIVYTIAVFIVFNLFILLHEEPRMKKDFGDSYVAYTKRVRRWF